MLHGATRKTAILSTNRNLDLNFWLQNGQHFKIFAVNGQIFKNFFTEMVKISKILLNLNSPSKLAPSEQLDGKYFLKEKNF